MTDMPRRFAFDLCAIADLRSIYCDYHLAVSRGHHYNPSNIAGDHRRECPFRDFRSETFAALKLYSLFSHPSGHDDRHGIPNPGHPKFQRRC